MPLGGDQESRRIPLRRRLDASCGVQGRAVLVVIPSKPYDFDLRPVVEEMQEIADSDRISIALQEVQGFERP
jgi:hypothetical protein